MGGGPDENRLCMSTLPAVGPCGLGMEEENRLFWVNGGKFAETAIWRARFHEVATQWALGSELPRALSSRIVRSLHLDTCYRDWRWSPSLPEFQWQLVEREVPQEHILHSFQMPVLSDPQARQRFCELLSNMSPVRYCAPQKSWESYIAEAGQQAGSNEPHLDGEDDEVACPHDMMLMSFTLARPGRSCEALKILYIEHFVDLDMGMIDGSVCLACAGRGDPIVLAQWRLHSEAEMFDPAHLARPEEMDKLLAHTSLEGHSVQDFVAFLLSVCAVNPSVHPKDSLRMKRPLDKQICKFIRDYERSFQVPGFVHASGCSQREKARSNISRTYRTLAAVHDLLPSGAQRKMYQKYLESAISFLMGQHARLGKHSPVSCLPALPISIIVAGFLRDQVMCHGGGRRSNRRRRRELEAQSGAAGQRQ